MNTNKTSKKSSSTFDRAIRWPSALGLLAFLATIVVSSFSDPAAAAEPRRAAKKEITTVTRAKFDHIKTGFPLIGAHIQAKCETCHQNGVFKGTARQCDVCHAPGNRMAATFKGQKHVSTTESCDRCHTAVVWAPVRFNHSQVAPGSCATCHNTVMASGKPTDHPPTNASCDKCHNTSIWTSAAFSHDASTVGNCSNCHGGAGPGLGRPNGHIPLMGTAKQCDSCHTSQTTFTSRVMDHGGLNNQCSTCHNGSFVSQNANMYSNSHAGGTVNVAQCDTCHKSFSTWATTAKPDHGIFTAATNCAQCHGKTASGPSSTQALHATFSATSCFSCHTVAAWTPASKWNHSQVTTTGNCSTCHDSAHPPADGKVSNHIGSSSGSCDVCHKAGFSIWAGGKFHANVNVTTGCETCHNAKPSVLGPQYPSIGTSAIHKGVTTGCEKCHTSPSIPWSSGGVNHAGLTTGCTNSGCHVSGGAGTVPSTTVLHATFGTTCFTCHGVKPTAWYPASKWTHASQTPGTGKCDTCHTAAGAYPPADGKGANHIGNSSGSCDACHKAGYTTWAGGKFHANVSVATGCETCHNAKPPVLGPQYTSVPTSAIHSGVSTGCEKCHTSPSTPWSSGGVNHAGLTTGCTNSGCHVSGGAGTVPSTTVLHATFGTTCFTCHGVKPTAWYPASKWTHASQTPGTGKCDTCHTAAGAYPPADGKGANHIGNSSGSCDACHKAGYTTWAGGKFHANVSVATGCETCHNAKPPVLGPQYTSVPTSAIHSGVSTGCEKCHTSPSTPWSSGGVNHAGLTTGCTNSGCHVSGGAGTVPSTTVLHATFGTNCFTCHGVKPTAWYPASKWSHASQTPGTGKCDTCHTGGYPPADGKVTNHIGNSTGSCDACHKAGYTTWAGGRFHANVSVSTGCATCHNMPGTVGPVTTSKPNTTVHNGVTACEGCHTSPSTPWASAVFKHTAANAVGTGTCDTCHIANKVAMHIPTGSSKCDACHKSQVVWSGGMYHTNVSVSTGCATCHNIPGTVGPVTTSKPNTAIHTGVTVCETCHTSPSIPWSSAVFKHDATTTNNCLKCHTGTGGGMVMNQATHIPGTSAIQCDQCHKNTNVGGFATRTMNHTVVAATPCATCHSATYNSQGADMKSAKHIPYEANLLAGGSMTCNICHTGTTVWTTLSSKTVLHNGTQGNGAGWCKGCHLQGLTFSSTNLQKKSLTHQKSTGVTDCSQSGCHRPLGNQGSTYSSW